MNLVDMPKEEFRKTLQAVAMECAARAHVRNNPRSTSSEAAAWASTHWQDFKSTALDLMAVLAADQENQKAAREMRN